MAEDTGAAGARPGGRARNPARRPDPPFEPHRRRFARALLAAVALAGMPGWAAASEGRIADAEVVSTDEGWVVNADIDLDLNPRLTGAILHGVSLYFVVDFVIERPRWYWFNETVVERTLNYRLSYHALTRSYRLSVGNFHQQFETLEGAVQTMRRLRNWQVAPAGALAAGDSYNAGLRFRLDTGQLPKPFQVTAIGSRDWSLDTGWQQWTFLAGAPDDQ